jgi:hypothetical protein
MSNEKHYIGQELALFAHARNWKEYYASIIRPYFGKRIVEVGAGIGATTMALCNGSQDEWICLEPDPALRNEIDCLIADRKLPFPCRTKGGFVADIPYGNKINTFVYIDVLEHIENDATQLKEASSRLSPGGCLIVLSPAFNFLYSPFDKSIGHYRRYDKVMYKALTPPGCRLEKLVYLDSIGAVISFVNRMILNQSMPTLKQIIFWDRYIIPITRHADKLFRYRFGRSLLGIWIKDEV